MFIEKSNFFSSTSANTIRKVPLLRLGLEQAGNKQGTSRERKKTKSCEVGAPSFGLEMRKSECSRFIRFDWYTCKSSEE